MASQWCGGTVPGAVQAEPSTTDWCNSQLVLTVWPTCGGLSVRQHMKLGLTVCCKAVSTFLAESLCISNDWTCSPERWAGWDRGPTCFTQGKVKGYARPGVCMPGELSHAYDSCFAFLLFLISVMWEEERWGLGATFWEAIHRSETQPGQMHPAHLSEGPWLLGESR